MRIYFAGSIRGGRGDAALYARLIRELKTYGEVMTEHVGIATLDDSGEFSFPDSDIHDRDLGWILESDVVVAEVTTPSLGVGYEIGRAVQLGKRVLCLFRSGEGKRLSAMISGCHGVTVRTYESEKEAADVIRRFLIG